MRTPKLSLCLPTNGIMEWVFPVLESIYEQNVEPSLFEVIVTNNGDNDEFHYKMLEYAKNHDNLIYKKTEAYMFHNQLEALKLASGLYLKLINHRAVLTEDSIRTMIGIINDNAKEKPIMYFSCGALKRDYMLKNFDEYVKALGVYASWTTGVGIWKEDYDKLPADMRIDKISPHSCVLFANRDRDNYKIYDFVFSKEIESSHSKKGKYDLYKAFGVEELSITQNLYIDGDITARTLKKVKKDYRDLVAGFYSSFNIMRVPCSYNLNGFNDSMGIYFNKYDILCRAYVKSLKVIALKIAKIILRR